MKDLLIKFKYGRIIRYLISGGTAAVVDLGALYILVHFFHVWYLLSATIAFLIAFCVSFVMQKFFTFSENSKEGMHKQAFVYFIVALANLCLNTLFMYVLVDKMNFHYLLAQVVVSGIIAIYSFFVYKHFIFADKFQR